MSLTASQAESFAAVDLTCSDAKRWNAAKPESDSETGREMVEALLTQFERGVGVMTDKAFKLNVLRGVREKLGLGSKGLSTTPTSS